LAITNYPDNNYILGKNYSMNKLYNAFVIIILLICCFAIVYACVQAVQASPVTLPVMP